MARFLIRLYVHFAGLLSLTLLYIINLHRLYQLLLRNDARERMTKKEIGNLKSLHFTSHLIFQTKAITSSNNLFVMQITSPTRNGSSSSSASSVSRTLFTSSREGDPKLQGCIEGNFVFCGTRYGVRWEKQTRDYESMTLSTKNSREYKHGHVFLLIFQFSPKGKLVRLNGIDVTMEMLPNERSSTGMIHLFNFIINRDDNDRHILESVAFRAIIWLFDKKLAILATDSLELVNGCIGNAAHRYLRERFDLTKDSMDKAVITWGDFIKHKKSENIRSGASKTSPSTYSEVARPIQGAISRSVVSNSSSSVGSVRSAVRPFVFCFATYFICSIISNVGKVWKEATDRRSG